MVAFMNLLYRAYTYVGFEASYNNNTHILTTNMKTST